MNPADATHTIANVARDFPDWHRGRPHYLVWAVEVDPAGHAQLQAHVAALQRALADLLLPGYVRQPHVTLGLCGFAAARAAAPDEFDATRLQAQVSALQALAPEPFTLAVGAPASFLSVPYLGIGDAAGALAALRRCVAGGPLDTPPADYVPHLTLGLYAGAWPLAAVAGRLSACVCGAPWSIAVDGIALMAYDTAQVGGPLHRLARYDFGCQTLCWDGPHPLLRPAGPAAPSP